MPACSKNYGRYHDVMKKAYSYPEWRARAKQQLVDIASQTDFLDGDIDGYYRRTSVEETEKHEDLRGIPIAEVAAERGVHPFDLMMDLSVEDELKTRFRNLPRVDSDELTE